MHHGSEIREREPERAKESQREPKRAKESLREPRPFWHRWQDCSVASFLSSPSSYVILIQKPQELDDVSLPRDRLSGRPFSTTWIAAGTTGGSSGASESPIAKDAIEVWNLSL